MSRDNPPVIVSKILGSLRPASEAAEMAFAAISNGTEVEIVVKKATPNTKRMRLYWVVAKKAADNWPMREGAMTSRALHRQTKEELGIGDWITTATGKRIFDADSISFADMTEDQRAAYINAAFALWSLRLGVDAETLVSESQAA